MNAVPLGLKKAIGVGIGLFILIIGFAGGGFVVPGARHRRHVPPAHHAGATSCSGSA